MIFPLIIVLGLPGPKVLHVPVVAQVAGITLGKTTVEQFEAKHGKGFVSIGGHSNSGRGWYVANRGWALEADGFNYWNGKEIIDDLRIHPEKDGHRVPRINIGRSELGLLSKISFGESRSNVERALGKKVDKDAWTKFSGLIRYPRKPANKDSRTYTTWHVVFIFKADKLTGLQMSAD